MAVNVRRPQTDDVFVAYSSTLGASGGSGTIPIFIPYTARLMEAGFIPQVAINSTTTCQVDVSVNNGNSTAASVASTVTNLVSSTNFSVASQFLYAGAVASTVTAYPNPTAASTYLNEGDCVLITTSGGDAAAKSGMVYAKVRRY